VNGGGASPFGSTRTGGIASHEEPDFARRGEAAAALWVALAERVHAPQPPLPPAELEPPSAWRGRAGDLTPQAGAPAATADGAAGSPASLDRLTLRVDGGHLGELSVTLDRENGALRVVIGLQNERFIREVTPDARALRMALESAGLSVHSLNIVPAAQVGTVLAQRRVTQSAHEQATDPAGSEPQQPQTHQRLHKRLKLIG
jgi:hypothetical protein